MRTIYVGVIGAVLAGVLAANSPVAWAEEQAHEMAHHVFATPESLTWADGPPSLPAGAQFAVIEGDPKQEGLFTMRIKLPAQYRIPAHWHPADEHVTVMSGTFHMGAGDQLDQTKGMALPAGSFALMPAKAHHFAWASEETVVQLHGLGPWQIHYLNAADDPRTQPQ